MRNLQHYVREISRFARNDNVKARFEMTERMALPRISASPRETLLVITICIATLFPVFGRAQNNKFTHAELFEGAYPDIFNKLPDVQGWEDDNNYIQRNADGQVVSVNAVSGKSHPNPAWRVDPKAPSHGSGEFINPTPSPDRKWIAYTKKDHNLYLMNDETGKEIALTNDGSDSILNGYASWVYYEEIFGRPSKYKAFWWSGDSKHLCYMRFDDSKVPVFSIYIPDGQHGYLENRHYPQAGDPNPEVKIGIVAVDNAETIWTDFNSARDQYFGMPMWTPENKLWIPWMNREQDTLIEYEIATDGTKQQVYLEHQATWINLKEVQGTFYFLNDNQGYIVKSDKDGWQNLYLYDIRHKLVNQITIGQFWGTEILQTDTKRKQLIIKARKDNSARFDLYRVSFDGKTTTRLSQGNYSYDDIWMSPGGKYFLATYSSLSTPPVMALFDSKGKMVREVANTKTTAMARYFIPAPVLKTVRSSDGLFNLPMTIKYPYGFDSTKKYPVLISIYGGPDRSTVHDHWTMPSGTSQWFSQEGLILITMDNRSSGHFGKTGMNYIFKQLGKWEIEDYMTCGRWLRSQPWVDTNKIAITGGSFGGYMTCLALTYGADVFTHGMADFPVTDWHLYDSHYTERFMNTPQNNPEGYKKTSVLTYANKYKGKLRISHGSADDNVHFQNTLQFIDLLQNLNKQFELMVYPNQRHGFRDLKVAYSTEAVIEFVERELLNKCFTSSVVISSAARDLPNTKQEISHPPSAGSLPAGRQGNDNWRETSRETLLIHHLLGLDA